MYGLSVQYTFIHLNDRLHRQHTRGVYHNNMIILMFLQKGPLYGTKKRCH